MSELYFKKLDVAQGIVWIVGGFASIAYAVYGVFFEAPGVVQLANFLASAEGSFMLVAVFIAILIEGIYIFGAFFPGSSIVVLLAIIGLGFDLLFFVAIIFCVYVGWVFSSLVNVILADVFRHRLLPHFNKIDDRRPHFASNFVTWFPVFRANSEVARVISGSGWKTVFFQSVLFKLIVSMLMGLLLFFFGGLVDVNQIDNREGFLALFLVGVLSCGGGASKMWRVR